MINIVTYDLVIDLKAITLIYKIYRNGQPWFRLAHPVPSSERVEGAGGEQGRREVLHLGLTLPKASTTMYIRKAIILICINIKFYRNG